MDGLRMKDLEKILELYGQQGDFVFPDAPELDEKQKEFIRGYLSARIKDNGGLDEGKEEEIRQQILQARTKYCERILELLYQEGELYHGDIAEKLNMSPSGLNSVIKKMMEGNTPIIHMMQLGKYKIYTLPDDVRRYMEKRSGSRHSNESNSLPKTKNLLLCLQKFVEEADADWRETMNLLFQGEEEGIGDSVRECFKELMVQVQWAEENDEDGYEEIKKVLKNDVLIYLMEEYLNVLKDCELIKEEILNRKNGKRIWSQITNQ